MRSSGLALAAALLAGLAVPAFAQDSGAGEKPGAPPPVAAEPASAGIPWTHDYAEGKARAAKEGKGLLVYLTPKWFD